VKPPFLFSCCLFASRWWWHGDRCPRQSGPGMRSWA